ncbi:MAG TPA: bifunctional folylpolyglutamate synthase/dihydrofolate synthase [bacterium (Candidatus Stahlbacteria)]|nr:bifunctional folylpolyglutamate synthase/dihydrofolate synthase [Candidatus Stahlbacteria bacterium]
MNFDEAVNFIYGFQDYERKKIIPKFDLSSFLKFLQKLNSPHKKVNNPILVAGTKGKGSTAAILSSILSKVGITGLFTSPHLKDIRERIRINGIPIPKEEFVRTLEYMIPYIDDKCTVFEILTALSFIYFTKRKTEFSIFEVGMGGRLDSTNVTTPSVSAITPISLDHTEILGRDLETITYEKAGIIKEGETIVSAPQDPVVLKIIEQTCKERNARLLKVGDDLWCEDVECDNTGSRFKVEGENYSISLLGRHQVINALTAFLVADTLGISRKVIKEGLHNAKWPARIQVIKKEPYIILDGAHNVASCWVLRRAIVELFSWQKLILVFSALADKDIEGMAHVLAPITDKVFVTKIDSPRAADTERIYKAFEREDVATTIVENLMAAFNEANDAASARDLILVTGSLYLVGAILPEDKI